MALGDPPPHMTDWRNPPEPVPMMPPTREELEAALRQARKDGAEMRRQRDLAVKLRDRLLAERAAAVARADTIEDTNLTLVGQLEDMRAALATAEALDRSQVDGRWTAIWDRCG